MKSDRSRQTPENRQNNLFLDSNATNIDMRTTYTFRIAERLDFIAGREKNYFPS